MSTPPVDQLRDDLRTATALLERLASDRALLVAVPAGERLAFLDAVARVFNPDARARRAMVKATARERKAAAAARDDALLDQTGIRALRKRPVATTPNMFLSAEFEQRPPDSRRRDGGSVHDVRSRHGGTSVHGDGAALGDGAARADGTVHSDGSPPATEPAEALVPQHCYICKEKFTELHHFYDQMCQSCGDFNHAKRTELADLRGRTALLTGGRIKIGYQAGLKLLRSGARLLVTTRFPHDSAMRYAAESDFEEWRDRLQLFGLDLRHTPSVEVFCQQLLATEPRLDFIINNACQTVRRPPAFYAHMMDAERAQLDSLPAHARALVGATGAGNVIEAPASQVAAIGSGAASAAVLSQLALLPDDLETSPALFPPGQLDLDQQQVDLRERNSWRLLLDEVPSVELLEVQLVNAIAPFIMNARLKPLMLRTPERDKHIVNVSAMEGQFYRNNKTTRHPHTNMAKAALNMMTRTSAADYEQHGIHMNSVDTGWVTDEDAAELAARKRTNHRFHPPLDIVDGAARITDPIIDGMNSGHHVWGQFLKDYRPTDW